MKGAHAPRSPAKIRSGGPLSPTAAAKLKQTLDRGLARSVGKYVVLFGLGGALIGVGDVLFGHGRDVLDHSLHNSVPWALFGLWLGLVNWNGRALRYEGWLAAGGATQEGYATGATVEAETSRVVRRPTVRLAALALLCGGMIAWLAGAFFLGPMHDRIQSALCDGKASEVQAEAHSLLMLAWLYSPSFVPFEARSDCHVALGLGALGRDDVEASREHLLDAGKTSSLPHRNPVGVSMLLVKALLVRGERDAVLAYLDACRAPGQMENADLDAWSEQVRAGKMPDFGPALLH